MNSSPQSASKCNLLDFLNHYAYHNYWTNVTKEQICDCEVCIFDLIKWEDPVQMKFSIRWFDGRSKRNETSDYLFLLYGMYVATKKDGHPSEYKKLMKAAVGKHVKEKHLKELKGNSSVDLKHYQFCPPGVPEEKDTENITPPPATATNYNAQPMGISFPKPEFSFFGGDSNIAYQSDSAMVYPSTSQTVNQPTSYDPVLSTDQFYCQPGTQYHVSNSFPSNENPVYQQTEQKLLPPMYFQSLNNVLHNPSEALPVISDEDLMRNLPESQSQEAVPGNGLAYETVETNRAGHMHQTSSASGCTITKTEEQKSPGLMHLASSGSASTIANTPFIYPTAPLESFPYPLLDFDAMTIVPKANQQRFDDFLAEDVEPGMFEPRDLQFIRENLSFWEKISRKLYDQAQATEMKITLYVKEDADCPASRNKSKNILSRDGFRILSKNSELGTLQEVSKFGPVNLKPFRLPVPTANNSEKVQKCLKTFRYSGMCFMWKHYSAPQNLTKVESLCWRLYCYKICRGYPKNEGVETNKVQRLPMCLKTPLRENGFEMKEHEFYLVFDVLKMCAVAARLANEAKNKGSTRAKETHKQLYIYLGLKSDKLYDDDSLPVRIQIQSPLVSKVFTDFLNRGKPPIKSLPDNNSVASKSTFDSNVGHSRGI